MVIFIQRSFRADVSICIYTSTYGLFILRLLLADAERKKSRCWGLNWPVITRLNQHTHVCRLFNITYGNRSARTAGQKSVCVRDYVRIYNSCKCILRGCVINADIPDIN